MEIVPGITWQVSDPIAGIFEIIKADRAEVQACVYCFKVSHLWQKSYRAKLLRELISVLLLARVQFEKEEWKAADDEADGESEHA